MDDALELAKATAGGPVALARLLTGRGSHITSQAISQWKRAPAERALDIEKVTGVPRWKLRPDLWSEPKKGAA